MQKWEEIPEDEKSFQLRLMEVKQFVGSLLGGFPPSVWVFTVLFCFEIRPVAFCRCFF